MGSNKDKRKRIAGLERQIGMHDDKIQTELNSDAPNYLRIKKWLKDIRVFEAEIEKLYKKLPEGKVGGKQWKR